MVPSDANIQTLLFTPVVLSDNVVAVSVPLLLPLIGDIDSQGALFVIVQLTFEAKLNVELLPLANAKLIGPLSKSINGPAASCVTKTVSLIERVKSSNITRPLRAAPLFELVASIVVEPFPFPDEGVIVIQFTNVLALHDVFAVMVTLPLLPFGAASVIFFGDTLS